ncbi:MAG: galactokinase [Terriglobales bacterium]
MIVTRTPFRISFLGGGTDFPAWYRDHGGAVLATAIDKYCYISCRYLPPFFQHHSRIVYNRIEDVHDNSRIEHPAVRACLQELGITAGMEIHHDADLPARTGLGTSSAFVVGLLHALHALRQQPREAADLARAAITIEREVLRENVGAQDQILAAYGGFHVIRFRDDGRFHLEPLALPPQRLQALREHLHIYFTGCARTSSDIAGHQIANIRCCTAELRALQELVEEGERLLAGTGPLAAFGALLHQAWVLKRRLSAHVSSAELDGIYAHARAAGALGGKLLGAGGGGFFLFLVPPDRSAAFQQRMAPLMRVPFSFPAHGSELVLCDTAGECAAALDARQSYRIAA